MKTTVVWFKTDLRVNDNETLSKAIAQSDLIIPVFCFDESHFVKSDFGFQKTGSYRATFLLESIQDLDKNLRALGSGLIIVKGKPEELKAKILEGKIASYFKDRVLLEQTFIKNPDQTVAELINAAIQKFGEKVEVVRYMRYGLLES